jgi:hypothetical protein
MRITPYKSKMPQALESRKTMLVQRTIGSVGYANEQFTNTGPDGNEACIVAVPENNACCFNCLVQVPSGPNVLWSSFGANMGKLDPGMKCCWPAWNSVTALVSKQVVTYNAAPKKCPTKDMVFVDGASPTSMPQFVSHFRPYASVLNNIHDLAMILL